MTDDAFDLVLVPILRDLRDHLDDLVVNERATTALRQQLAQSLSVRHHITHEEGDAKAKGFLADFLGLIPTDCERGST